MKIHKLLHLTFQVICNSTTDSSQLTRADVNELLEKVVLSDRQTRIFEMFYLKRQNVGFIADTLGFSERVICEELNVIRDKIQRAIPFEIAPY